MAVGHYVAPAEFIVTLFLFEGAVVVSHLGDGTCDILS